MPAPERKSCRTPKLAGQPASPVSSRLLRDPLQKTVGQRLKEQHLKLSSVLHTCRANLHIHTHTRMRAHILTHTSSTISLCCVLWGSGQELWEEAWPLWELLGLWPSVACMRVLVTLSRTEFKQRARGQRPVCVVTVWPLSPAYLVQSLQCGYSGDTVVLKNTKVPLRKDTWVSWTSGKTNCWPCLKRD